MPARLSDAERDRLHDQFSVYPDAELLYMLLGYAKMLEHEQARLNREAIQRLMVLLGEVFTRWVPAEPFDQAMEMLYGDEEPRIPEVSALEGSDDG
jgi:hypothetical protein